MLSRDIRAGFLDYFKRQGHRIVPSSPLVPADDPTLLFTNAGMNQFKDLFLGRERRDYLRAASSQKCMRVSGKHNDLDNVGPSLRHHTFFEMLGNFSFGDYFKADAIPFAWELLTTVWGLAPERLYPTIFRGESGIPRDDEAAALWRKFVPAGRIAELGMADNFWAMGETGPCGRCSEIHYFRGDDVPCPEPVCKGLECDCDRFVEAWNNVFMEFDRQADGRLVPLPALSVDTGMGLERVTAVIQGRLSNYDTDLFTPVIRALESRASLAYGADPAADVSMRVVADHLRATTFLIADGVVPSNEWRGYVLRKIMRRAMRHGQKLGLKEPFLYDLVDVLAREMGDFYPELRRNRDAVVQVVRSEEDRFDAVLTSGLPRLEEVLDRAAASGGAVAGDEIFKLYDSFGVPLDFAEDLAEQRKLTIDRAGYERAMAEQRERARAGSSFRAGAEAIAWQVPPERQAELERTGDRFEGYERTAVDGAVVLALLGEGGAELDEAVAGREAYVALDRSPFYVEAGGQVSDTGELHAARGSADVRGMLKVGRWPRLHRVHVRSGSLRRCEIVTAAVDQEARDATRRNHTATHLLHAALRQVLGTHVKQAGSLVSPDRLRFDFVHHAAVTDDQLVHIERLVNEQVRRNAAVGTEIKSTDEAIAAGAMALFGEKYGDRVRVVSVPGFSQELCGGTHCRATGDIGFFTITEESGIAAGVRRIEAVTGAGAVTHHQQRRQALDAMLQALATTEDQATEAIRKLQAEVKRLGRETEQLQMKLALGVGATADRDDTQDLGGGVRMIARKVAGLDKGPLRGLADSLRDRLQSGVVVLASEHEGKVLLVVSVSKDLTGRVQAGRIVKEIAPLVGGGGGGRPDFAEAGGKNPAGIDELMAVAPKVLKNMLNG
jgi:alanyl-tRNA synthetase